MVNKNDLLEPRAKDEIDRLKIKVANETLGRDMNQQITESNYESVLDQKKYEIAQEIGLKDKIENVGWENMTTKEVGKIGGRMGGKIGGQMVKELIAMAESQMAPVSEEATNRPAIEHAGKG